MRYNSPIFLYHFGTIFYTIFTPNFSYTKFFLHQILKKNIGVKTQKFGITRLIPNVDAEDY